MALIVGNSVNNIWSTGKCNNTVLNRNNPSLVNTIITKAQVYIYEGGNTLPCYIGTFYAPTAGDLTSTSWAVRSYAIVNPVVLGINTFDNLNITCNVGDIIGMWMPNPNFTSFIAINRNSFAGTGSLYQTTNTFLTSGYVNYSLAGELDFVLLGGFSADGKKINGVTNVKWNGVAITKFNGI